jgi:hypothetical protein
MIDLVSGYQCNKCGGAGGRRRDSGQWLGLWRGGGGKGLGAGVEEREAQRKKSEA